MRALHQVMLLAIKDLRLFFLDKGGLAFAFGFPLLLAFAFSMILPDTDLDERLRLRVATGEAAGGNSHAIIQNLEASREFEIIQLDPEDAFDQAEAGEISGYLLFPQGMTDDLFAGNPTSIQVVTGSSGAQAEALLYEVAYALSRELSLNSVAIAAAVELATEIGQPPDEPSLAGVIDELFTGDESAGQAVAGVRVEQVGDIEPVPAANYVLPAYVTMFLFFAAGFGAGELLREKRQNTFDRLIASGVSPATILAGKWAGTAVRALSQAIVLWTAGILLFGVDLGHDPLATMLVTVGMLVASASFALFLATIARSQNSADSIAVLAALTLAALGGSWWPLFIMPEWLQTLAKITPHAWANEAFNNLLLFGATLGQVYINILVLCGFAIVFALFAALRINVRDV